MPLSQNVPTLRQILNHRKSQNPQLKTSIDRRKSDIGKSQDFLPPIRNVDWNRVSIKKNADGSFGFDVSPDADLFADLLPVVDPRSDVSKAADDIDQSPNRIFDSCFPFNRG